MVSEEIKKIVELEQSLKQRQENELAESKRQLLLARRAGERAAEDNLRNLEVERQRHIQESEALAAKESKMLRQGAEERCEREKAAARCRLEETADWIVERVIGG